MSPTFWRSLLLYYYIRRLTDVISVAYRLSGSLILGIFSCVEKNYRFETADINIIGYASYFFCTKTVSENDCEGCDGYWN